MDSATDVYPAALARHYDEDYEVLRRDVADVAFYRELAREQGGPVLEVACGTGRVLLPVARAGPTVTGVDASPAMLERLREKLAAEPPEVRRRVKVVEGRFDALGVDGPFTLVFSAFRAFQHLMDETAQRAAMAEMARVLAPGGLLALDVFDLDPTKVRSPADDHVDYVLEVGDTRRERRCQAVLDPEARRIEGRFRWLVDGREVDAAAFQMKIVSRDELLALVEQAGLELVALSGDFDRSPWSADDPRELVLVARKPGPGRGGAAR